MNIGLAKWVGAVGMIKNRNFHAQFVDFSGLKFGNCSPTDFDCYIKLNNLFIFIETKYMAAPMPLGQRIAFEKLCDAIENSIVFVTEHDMPASKGDIDLANTIVTEYRWKRQWIIPQNKIRLFDAIQKVTQK